MRKLSRVFVLTLFLSIMLFENLHAQRKVYEIGNPDKEMLLLDTVYLEDINDRIFIKKEAFVNNALFYDYLGMSKQLQELSFIHLRMENFEMALSYLYEALRYSEGYGDEVDVAIVFRRLGVVYTEMGLNPKGLDYLEKSRDVLENYQDEYCFDLTKVYKNIGLNLIWQKNYKDAVPYLERAFALAKKCNLKSDIANGYVNLGAIYVYYEQYDSVLTYLDEAERIYGELNDSLGLGAVNNNRAEYYMQIGDYKTSLALYEKAYGFYYAVNEDQFRLGTLKNLASIHEKLGNYELAFQFSQQYADANKKMLLHKLNKTIEHMDVGFLQLQKRKNIENELILKNKQGKIRSYQVYLLSCLLVILLVVGGMLVYHRMIQEKLIKYQLEKEKLAKKNLKEEIDFKDRELEGMALNITNKNRFLFDVKEKLDVLNSSGIDDKKQISDIKFLISQYLQSDKELADFNKQVELLQQNFLFTMNDLYPELSENERQLCVLLRLGVSSKDIALMRNVSEKSVHMARYRLRKKMDLDASVNLVEYLKTV